MGRRASARARGVLGWVVLGVLGGAGWWVQWFELEEGVCTCARVRRCCAAVLSAQPLLPVVADSSNHIGSMLRWLLTASPRCPSL
jgi:hypothetical protein